MLQPARGLKQAPLSAALSAAAQAVAAVMAGRTPEAVLAGVDGTLRPAVLDLAYTTLRDCGRGDFLLGSLLERPLKDRASHALLLVALARLERRPEDAHTLVDQAVNAAGKHFKGLVNAVLRNFLRRRDALLAAADADPAARWRHPPWWLEKLRTAWPDDWQAIAAAGNTHPPLCLRINRRRSFANSASAEINSPPRSQTRLAAPHGGANVGSGRPSADYRDELAATGIAARPLDDTALLLDKPVPVERIAGFASGLVSVQDWGAQHAAHLLDVHDGMRVLDACAAPGGKTAHLLELADLELTALELDAGRARRIAENLDRLELVADVKVADASRPQDWWDGRPFDRILADVPCSASGVVRRHPDIKWLRRPEDVAGFARTQAAILAALWPTLATGGRMLFCTCSVFPEENAAQMRAFVTRHPDARLLPLDMAGDGLQLLPSAEHDGFYFALLGKKG